MELVHLLVCLMLVSVEVITEPRLHPADVEKIIQWNWVSFWYTSRVVHPELHSAVSLPLRSAHAAAAAHDSKVPHCCRSGANQHAALPQVGLGAHFDRCCVSRERQKRAESSTCNTNKNVKINTNKVGQQIRIGSEQPDMVSHLERACDHL